MKQWAQHINLNPYKTQRSQNTIQFASQKVSNSTINAKCPNLKHKSRLVHVQNTSTKTRSKTKPNDQNRSQSFTYCTFAYLCFTLIIWATCFVNWCWSFWGHFIECLNVQYVKDWVLFWSFDLVLNLVFVLVFCTWTNCALCFRFGH